MKRVLLLITGGGRIQCRRCQASNRAGKQCAKPAVRGKRVCNFHGGRSTGAKTPEGRASVKAAATKHGRYSKEEREKTADQLVRLRQLEDALIILGALPEGQQTRGPKPRGYKPLLSMTDVESWAEGNHEE